MLLQQFTSDLCQPINLLVGHRFHPKNSQNISDALVLKCFNAFFLLLHTTAPISHNLVLLLIYSFIHNLHQLNQNCHPMTSIDFTSLAQSASFVTLQTKYTKEFTCSNLPVPTLISSALSAFVTVFVHLALIAISYSPAALLSQFTSFCSSSSDMIHNTAISTPKIV